MIHIKSWTQCHCLYFPHGSSPSFLHPLIIYSSSLSSNLSPSPVLLSKLVRPSECQRIDAFRQPHRFKDTHPVNFFTEGVGRNFQGARTKTHFSSLLSLHTILLFFGAFTSFSLYVLDLSSPTHSLTQAFSGISFPLSHYLSSTVAELSLADAPDGSIILEHLSAVCLHHGSLAATGATGK